jgi:orotidine-5'-phosphate decarboxylase
LTTFVEKLLAASRRQDSLLCVGLDPDLARLPGADAVDRSQPGAVASVVEAFNRGIVEATADLVCAYKPNLAFYEALGLEGWEALRRTLAAIPPEIPVIADAKRGDVDNTSEAYARAIFDVWGFDAVTLAPYVGLQALEPFGQYRGRGLLILCKTSNPGSGDLQDLTVDWRGERLPLYQAVARRVVEWNGQVEAECGLVVGATYPAQLAEIRAVAPTLPILIPGVGAQSGSLEQAVRLGSDPAGELAIVNASRAILYASNGPDWQPAARQAAQQIVEEMRRARAVLA